MTLKHLPALVAVATSIFMGWTAHVRDWPMVLILCAGSNLTAVVCLCMLPDDDYEESDDSEE